MLHIDIRELKFKKVFIELRFKDVFKLPLAETKYLLLDKFTKKYPLYNAENPEQISFMNPERKRQMHIYINRIILDWDNPDSIEDFTKSTLNDLSFIIKTLNISEFNRIGVRTMNSLICSDQHSISQYIFKEYLSSRIQRSDFADMYFNPNVSFSGTRNNITFNFAINYQQEQMIEGTLNQMFQQHTTHLLVFDLDCYKENVKVSKLETVLRDVVAQNKLVPSYINSLKERKDELVTRS